MVLMNALRHNTGWYLVRKVVFSGFARVSRHHSVENHNQTNVHCLHSVLSINVRKSRSTTRGRLPPPARGARRAECGTSSRTAYSGAFGEPDEVRHTRRESKLNRPEEISILQNFPFKALLNNFRYFFFFS
ncbi:hypothetical protein AVEN_202114-1 [Araneus ventricosus]|uniref:Uncharacterized protein n=1 Tax=Araneus ventricosus TaxID=182803 RepID=A0A4Y2URR7_ARAVE|nr:hypothetical protein AVEN_202114-1 [Araneus ventricosus]